MGNEGLREVVPGCLQCPDRVLCLKEALNTQDGLDMQAKKLDRLANNGLIGRLNRWSQKKEIHRLMKKQKKKRKSG